MLTEFILVSGWFFWAVIAAVIVFDIFALSSDRDQGQAVAVTTLVAGAIVLFTDAFVGARASTMMTIVAVYIVVGVLWSIKRWYGFVVQRRDELRIEYADDRYIDKTPGGGNETFESYSAAKRPTAAQNKQRILSWMALWPFSLSWWVLTWPRRAFVWMYERLSTLFDRISAHVWASS